MKKTKKTKVETIELKPVKKGALHNALGTPDQATEEERIEKALKSKNPEVRKLAQALLNDE